MRPGPGDGPPGEDARQGCRWRSLDRPHEGPATHREQRRQPHVVGGGVVREERGRPRRAQSGRRRRRPARRGPGRTAPRRMATASRATDQEWWMRASVPVIGPRRIARVVEGCHQRRPSRRSRLCRRRRPGPAAAGKPEQADDDERPDPRRTAPRSRATTYGASAKPPRKLRGSSPDRSR
jgi:hypothetical protein